MKFQFSPPDLHELILKDSPTKIPDVCLNWFLLKNSKSQLHSDSEFQRFVGIRAGYQSRCCHKVKHGDSQSDPHTEFGVNTRDGLEITALFIHHIYVYQVNSCL